MANGRLLARGARGREFLDAKVVPREDNAIIMLDLVEDVAPGGGGISYLASPSP